MTVCYIGLGSNMGDSLRYCRSALTMIDRIGGVCLVRRSSFYRTEPVGQREQEWFVNAVAEISTSLTPERLLDNLLEVEKVLGRVRQARWTPRTIDLDILFYGHEIISQENLVVPHPELHQRRFVLEPLNELAPCLIHPVYCVSVSGLMGRLRDDSRVERMECLPDPG